MIPTLFSVSYAGLRGQPTLDIESFIRKAATLRYPAVELMAKRPHLSPLDLDSGKLDRVKQCAKENRIQIATVAGYTDFTGGGRAPEVPIVEMQIAYIRELASFLRYLVSGPDLGLECGHFTVDSWRPNRSIRP